MRTSDVATALGVHTNTIRWYEDSGLLPPVPRAFNGYRQYSALHLEQARLVQLALQWPYLGGKARLVALVTRAAASDLGMAMELAYQYLAHVRVERTYAEAAVRRRRSPNGRLRTQPRSADQGDPTFMLQTVGLSRHFRVKHEVVVAVAGIDLEVQTGEMDARGSAPQPPHVCCGS